MRDLISELDASGELLCIEKEVAPLFELAAVTKVVQHASNQTVLFENVKGSEFPTVTNIYNSRQRLCRLCARLLPHQPLRAGRQIIAASRQGRARFQRADRFGFAWPAGGLPVRR